MRGEDAVQVGMIVGESGGYHSEGTGHVVGAAGGEVEWHSGLVQDRDDFQS